MDGDSPLLPYSPSADELATQIISAYVANNQIRPEDVGPLFKSVRGSIYSPDPADASHPEIEIEKPSSAQIKKSITPDALISFIDGKPYKTLKRHLGTHGLDPHSYRQRYGLPNDYPVVASNYAAQRSALAKNLGLGTRPAINKS